MFSCARNNKFVHVHVLVHLQIYMNIQHIYGSSFTFKQSFCMFWSTQMFLLKVYPRYHNDGICQDLVMVSNNKYNFESQNQVGILFFNTWHTNVHLQGPYENN
jgi:hypothetical protein